MLSSIFRIVGTRSFKPLKFTNEIADVDTSMDELGLYIHIPFCKSLCTFCPYNKIKYDKKLSLKYKEALLKEIKLVSKDYKDKSINSVYFGGGTPALMVDSLDDILKELKNNFKIQNNIGIELHPRDINKELMYRLKDIGFDMVSIGIQSFDKNNLSTLGREYINGEEKVLLAKNAGFNVIDVDLIFGIKNQTTQSLKKDFEAAFNNGATQISTYPFIDFSYANNKHKPLNKKQKKELLLVLEEMSNKLNLKRTSVWTFGKKDVSKYSSITRDSYLGFGPSAATLTNSYFKINTFSVNEYIKSIDSNISASSLNMKFTKRTRGLYWLFWNAYTLKLNKSTFKKLFNDDLDKMFKVELYIGRLLGMLKVTNDGYELTRRGSYVYHILEQHYTHQYIDKTWRICGEEAWPKEIRLY